jgi:hypothetical protein
MGLFNHVDFPSRRIQGRSCHLPDMSGPVSFHVQCRKDNSPRQSFEAQISHSRFVATRIKLCPIGLKYK